MRLVKFFHRPPGSDDRKLQLSPGNLTLTGLRIQEPLGSKTREFLDRKFRTLGQAVAVFRQEAAKLQGAGFVETTHTDYMLRTLLPDPQPKPAWQQGLDEMMLDSLVGSLDERAKGIEALAGTPASAEPLYLWLAGHHALAASPEKPDALRLAQAAHDRLVARRAAKAPHYLWSLDAPDLEARILELLFEAQQQAGNHDAALAAIDKACDVDPSQDRAARRASFLLAHVPERRDEAFEDARRYGEFGGFDEILASPDYAQYLWRLKLAAKAKKQAGKAQAWHWSDRLEPAGEAALAAAEQQLGAALPEDYRRFLGHPGSTSLKVTLAEGSSELGFHRPEQLKAQRDNLFAFITRTEKDPSEAEAYFLREYGVSLRHLVPIAAPQSVSNCLVLHLGPGERHGWCFQWNHDGAWELEAAEKSFDKALPALTKGIDKRDAAQLEFLGIFLD
jgi:hypothetical protein